VGCGCVALSLGNCVVCFFLVNFVIGSFLVCFVLVFFSSLECGGFKVVNWNVVKKVVLVGGQPSVVENEKGFKYKMVILQLVIVIIF
jgi:hypothetical protein